MILKTRSKHEITLLIFTVSILMWGFLQNPQGQFSDIRGFYGMRYMDGEHHWPYTPHIPLGSTVPLNPVEYPALTGLIIWGLTYVDLGFTDPILNYYYLNSLINALFFILLVFLIVRLTRPSLGFLVAASPAAIQSLNLNWDIWAILPMILSLILFQSGKYTKSAVFLAISIATKFFPVVILFPVLIFFYREKKIREFFGYFFKCLSVWITLNAPFIFIDAEGWSYFYRFSFQRSLGEGSIFTLFGKLGIPITFPPFSYYVLNILIFAALAVFLLKSKRNHDILTTSFLAMFAFMFFGKQYSMQYILWLLSLAVLSLRELRWQKNRLVFLTFFVWQLTEYFFHLAYFRNLFSRVMVERGVEALMLFSDQRYGTFALIRYISIATFVISLVITLYNKNDLRVGAKRKE